MPAITNANGDISAYGLALGYRDTDYDVALEGKSVELSLSWNGCTYDVHVRVPSEDHHWAQFESLTEARAFKRKLRRARSLGEVYAECLSVMA